MKPKPLKGKIVGCEGCYPREYMFHQRDVKSAVEWLKGNIKSRASLRKLNNYEEWILLLIDEAFEDVIE